MAGTRGLSTFRGEQLRSQLLRDSHFDVNNKINEDKIDIQWHTHREILVDTKIDVYVQKNGVAVTSGQSSIDITSYMLNSNIATDVNTEGTVLEATVSIRRNGTEDFPEMDAQGDKVHGKLRNSGATFFLDFYSFVNGVETAYSFTANDTIDFKYVVRTNLSVIPTSALINAGSAFVEGATDAKAYMNLNQLMKDLYGAAGTLDGDGNANLATAVVDQIANEIQARMDADTQIRSDLASTVNNKGAAMIGVVSNANYGGATVQAVLLDLAQRLKSQENLNSGIAVRNSNTTNGYFLAGDFSTAEGRVDNLEATADAAFKAQADLITKLQTEDTREVYEATGGETGYTLVKGVAKPDSLFVSLNSALQVPGLHYVETTNAQGNVTGISFAPDTLKVVNGVPDNLHLWYKKVL